MKRTKTLKQLREQYERLWDATKDYDRGRRVRLKWLRVRRYSSVPRVVGGINGENAAERKETGKFPRWHSCKYRQFTRGSTRAHGITGGTNGINNKQYPGEMFCRGA